MKLGKDVQMLIDRAKAAGWTFEVTGGNHVRGKSPDGKSMVVVGGTPSDRRAYLNLRADLRRAGLEL